MGEPKLLLPWGKSRVIDQVLMSWTQSVVDEVVVIVRKNDRALRLACEKWPVTVVTPLLDPEDMKASVIAGLQWLDEHSSPADYDGCFVSPADVPGISPELIDSLVERYWSLQAETDDTLRTPLVVPRFGERPGHPALFSWSVTGRIRSLPQNVGINHLVQQLGKSYVELPAEARLQDMDTPEEYRDLRDRCD